MCEETWICVLGSLIVNILNSDVKAQVLLSFFNLFCVLCITAESCVCLVSLEPAVNTTVPKPSAFFSRQI